MASITMNDVAREAGVALDTARKVLREDPSVRSYIRERVLKAVKDLDYRPNLLARALREKKLDIVPISVMDLDTPYFGRMAQHLSRCLVEAGFEPSLCFSPAHLVQMHRALATSGSILVDGLDPKTLRSLGKSQRVVTINTGLEEIPGVCNIDINFDLVYREAVREVLRAGRKKIAFCSWAYCRSLRNGWPLQKFNSALAELSEAGVEPVGPSEAQVFDGIDALTAWLDDHNGQVDTVFCENDMVAGRMYAELARRGLQLPDDVMLVGCDGDYILPGSWSVAIDTVWLAEQAVALLRKQLDGEERPVPVTYSPFLQMGAIEGKPDSTGMPSRIFQDKGDATC